MQGMRELLPYPLLPNLVSCSLSGALESIWGRHFRPWTVPALRKCFPPGRKRVLYSFNERFQKRDTFFRTFLFVIWYHWLGVGVRVLASQGSVFWTFQRYHDTFSWTCHFGRKSFTEHRLRPQWYFWTANFVILRFLGLSYVQRKMLGREIAQTTLPPLFLRFKSSEVQRVFFFLDSRT